MYTRSYFSLPHEFLPIPLLNTRHGTATTPRSSPQAPLHVDLRLRHGYRHHDFDEHPWRRAAGVPPILHYIRLLRSVDADSSLAARCTSIAIADSSLAARHTAIAIAGSSLVVRCSARLLMNVVMQCACLVWW